MRFKYSFNAISICIFLYKKKSLVLGFPPSMIGFPPLIIDIPDLVIACQYLSGVL